MHAACGMLNAPEREGELAPSARDHPALCLASTVSVAMQQRIDTGQTRRMDPMQGELVAQN